MKLIVDDIVWDTKNTLFKSEEDYVKSFSLPTKIEINVDIVWPAYETDICNSVFTALEDMYYCKASNFSLKPKSAV